jgi:hypothetical protein
MDASEWFYEQPRPYIHSVVNTQQEIRLNIELDITIPMLDDIQLKEKDLEKIGRAGHKLNMIKYLMAVEHIKETAGNIIEEVWVNAEIEDYPFIEATDNRGDKFSHRLYSKLSFKNKQEYDYFVRLLRERVNPLMAPMIDPTSSMLRTPGSWKDNHCCKWTSNGRFSDSILTPAYMCDLLEIDDDFKDEVIKKPEYSSNLTDALYKKAIAHILTMDGLIGKFTPGRNTGNLITLTRLEPGYCLCCKVEHDKIDSFCVVSKSGHIYLGCFNMKKYQGLKVDLGDVMIPENYKGIVNKSILGVNWNSISSSLKNMRKAMKTVASTGMSKAETEAVTEDQKAAIKTMLEMAEKNQKELDREIFYYGDSKYIHKRVFTDEKVLTKYIGQVIVKIEQGGNCFYISKDKWKDTQHYTEIKHSPWSGVDDIDYEIINPGWDKREPINKFNPLVIKKKLSLLCLDWVKCNNFRTVDFIPELIPKPKQDTDIFNLFEGFRFGYEQRTQVPELIKPFIDHVINVFGGRDPQMGKTVLQWFAHIVQKPTLKSYALLIQGGQGSGKSLVYEIFKKCLGSSYAIQFTKMSDLTQTHNNIVRGRLLVNLNEATNFPSIENVNILKGFITDEELLINPKCCPLYYVSNFARVLITTNCEFAIRLDPGDRRYLCLRSNDEFVGNIDYFNTIINLMQDEAFIKELFLYFANLDISDFVHNKPPMTQYKRQLINSQMPDIYYFMQDLIEGEIGSVEFENGEAFVTKELLFTGYRGYCERNNIRAMGIKDFLRDIQGQKFNIEQRRRLIDGVRHRGFIINKESMLKIYKKLLGVDFEFQQD